MSADKLGGKALRVVAASVLFGPAAFFTMGQAPAYACSSPNSQRLYAAGMSAACCTTTTIDITGSSNTRVKFKDIPPFRDGPGGTIEVKKEYTGSASYSITAGGSVEVGGVLVKAKAEISGTLTKVNSTTATNGYTHDITKGKMGNVVYVSYGKNVKYRKLQYKSNCSYTVVASGAITFPSSTEGWYYWETNP